ERARLHLDELLLAGPRDLRQRPHQGGPVDRLAGAEDLDDRDAAMARDVVDGVDLVQERCDSRLDMRMRDPDELGVLVAREVDVAAVGDARDDEFRHAPEQLLVVERLAQLLRRLEEQREPGARALGLSAGFALSLRKSTRL